MVVVTCRSRGWLVCPHCRVVCDAGITHIYILLEIPVADTVSSLWAVGVHGLWPWREFPIAGLARIMVRPPLVIVPKAAQGATSSCWVRFEAICKVRMMPLEHSNDIKHI